MSAEEALGSTNSFVQIRATAFGSLSTVGGVLPRSALSQKTGAGRIVSVDTILPHTGCYSLDRLNQQG